MTINMQPLTDALSELRAQFATGEKKMLTFRIEIACDNDAFYEDETIRSNESAGTEVREILARLLIQDLTDDGPWPLFDTSGNRVGSAAFEFNASL